MAAKTFAGAGCKVSLTGGNKSELEKISDEIFVDYINVYDYTAQHENHATFEGNYHLSMTLVSPDFESMSLIERHQLVYKALDEYMHGELKFPMQSVKTNTRGE